jgi:hypothetical protein
MAAAHASTFAGTAGTPWDALSAGRRVQEGRPPSARPPQKHRRRQASRQRAQASPRQYRRRTSQKQSAGPTPDGGGNRTGNGCVAWPYGTWPKPNPSRKASEARRRLTSPPRRPRTSTRSHCAIRRPGLAVPRWPRDLSSPLGSVHLGRGLTCALRGVFWCVARGRKACASFMCAGCSWWAVDGCWWHFGAPRGRGRRKVV